jgi:hypothetical protein
MHPIRLMDKARRLRGMNAAELRWRARSIVRTHFHRRKVSTRGSRWERAALSHVLVPGVLGAEAEEALQRGDWFVVEQRLRRMLRERPSRFVIDPASANTLRREIVSRWPDAPVTAAADADPLVIGRFNLLGYRELSFTGADGQEVDWHFDPVHGRRMPHGFWADVHFLDPDFGDHKIVWELNRHQHFLRLGRAWWLTGDARYRDAIVSHVRSWLAANPPLVGVNWASMLELAFRSISWVAAIHFLLADVPQSAPSDEDVFDRDPWLLDMCVALDRQLRQVEQNLSLYFSPNTHLTGEALALYVAGVALPEFARSAQWIDVGRRVLLREVERQIADDGGHAERSTHYHRYTLDFYELALLTAERAGDVDAVAVFSDAVTRLARFMRAIADDNGRVPQIGDDDGGMLWPLIDRDPRDVGDSLALATVLLNGTTPVSENIPEEVFWIAWSGRMQACRLHRAPAPTPAWPVNACAFPTTGYVVARSRRGDHLVFDVGRHGFLNGGHAHADALAITLSLAGQPFVIDPGTATYTMDRALRDRMRATSSHNTMTVDGQASATPAGPFHWATRADARLDTWRHTTGFAWAEASHEAFFPAGHRRTIFYSEAGGCLVIDEVTDHRPGAEHMATVHWHFDPEWVVTCDGPHRLFAAHWTGRTGCILTDHGDVSVVCGDETSGVGWCSPRYGVLVPTSTAHITRKGPGPLELVTWLGECHASDPPALERLRLESDRSSRALGVRLHQGAITRTTMVRPGRAAMPRERRCDTPEYDTNARLLHYTLSGRRLVDMSIADATRAHAHDHHLLSVEADEPLHELHASVGAECLELASSSPPPRLRLAGDVLRGLRVIRANGREVPAARRSGTSSVTIVRADWGTPQWEDASTQRPPEIGARPALEFAAEAAER